MDVNELKLTAKTRRVEVVEISRQPVLCFAVVPLSTSDTVCIDALSLQQIISFQDHHRNYSQCRELSCRVLRALSLLTWPSSAARKG